MSHCEYSQNVLIERKKVSVTNLRELGGVSLRTRVLGGCALSLIPTSAQKPKESRGPK